MKYKIGEVCKTKATGEKVKIVNVDYQSNPTLYYIRCMISGYIAFEQWLSESQLKKYCPTRAGKRGKDGRFIKQSNEWICTECGKGGKFINGYPDHPCPHCIDNISTHENIEKINKNFVQPSSVEVMIIEKINEIIERLNTL